VKTAAVEESDDLANLEADGESVEDKNWREKKHIPSRKQTGVEKGRSSKVPAGSSGSLGG